MTAAVKTAKNLYCIEQAFEQFKLRRSNPEPHTHLSINY
jgi:hypothetical protein